MIHLNVFGVKGPGLDHRADIYAFRSFFNHRRNVNISTKYQYFGQDSVVVLTASRDITENEELFFDYLDG